MAVAMWRFVAGSAAGDAEAVRFVLSSTHVSFILNASERPLWFHHVMALAPASSTNAPSPFACSSFATSDAPCAATRTQRRLQRLVPMAFLTPLVQRGTPLVALSSISHRTSHRTSRDVRTRHRTKPYQTPYPAPYEHRT